MVLCLQGLTGKGKQTLAAVNIGDPMQVLIRVQISKPRIRNALRTVKLNLAGVLFSIKTGYADELLNLTVDTVRCIVLQTTSEFQMTLIVQSVQLDNQLLETRHPVVLAPAGVPGLESQVSFVTKLILVGFC